MAKVNLNQSLRKKLKEKLFKSIFKSQTERLIREIDNFSEEFYNSRISVELQKKLNTMEAENETGNHWLNYSSRMPVNLPDGEKTFRIYWNADRDTIDTLMVGSNTNNSCMSSEQYTSLTLWFKNPKPLPTTPSAKFTTLTDEEFKKLESIIKRHKKQRDSKVSQLHVGFSIIGKAKSFEDLFSDWAASEKLFKTDYLEEIAYLKQVKEGKKMQLTGVDFEKLNQELGLI